MDIAPKKWPIHAEDEIEAVTKVLKSGLTNYWTGSEIKNFEKEFAEYNNCEFAIALMNGTIALEAALHAINIKPHDEVITSCRTFIASASCIARLGAIPIMADVDADSQNITPETILPHITAKTKAIIVVHLAGWPADMEGIMQLAKKYNLKVVEDCAQAHGAKIKDKYVGTWGDIAAFSFCQDKIITTGGEGGMITTNNKQLYEAIWSMKDHGKNQAKTKMPNKNNTFKWLHDSFGTNWRMTEMQAAIGRVQLKKLDNWLDIRNNNANILNNAFNKISFLRLTIPKKHIKHAYYKYYTFVIPELLHKSWTRDKLIAEINNHGIPCYSGSCSEIYLENAFSQNKLTPKNSMVTAKNLGETSLMFLIDPSILPKELEKNAFKLTSIMQKAAI